MRSRGVLPLRCFFFIATQSYNILVHFTSFLVLLTKYSPMAILHAAHFRRVVNRYELISVNKKSP